MVNHAGAKGYLAFFLVSRVFKEGRQIRFFILDLARVTSIDQSASTLLANLIHELQQAGKVVLLTGTDRHYPFTRFLKQNLKAVGQTPILEYTDIDRALEYAEDRMLGDSPVKKQAGHSIALQEQPLCRHFDPAELERLHSLLQGGKFPGGRAGLPGG